MTRPTCHTCGRRHRTRETIARCIQNSAIWILGTGRWALLAHCGVLSVSLHDSRRDAEQSRLFIDRTGCGHECNRDHQIIDSDGMNLEEPAR